MDAAFIQQNQIIERYLMGKLPLKGAQDFERWCRENPDTVAQLGLSDRINSALRLLDAAGEPLPWTETQQAAWQRLPVFAGVAVVGLFALIVAIAQYSAGREKSAQIALLQKSVTERPLYPVQATRPITMALARHCHRRQPD
jgi:ferric-dicitrate binding protein FerR (iron transport regulator)